MISQNWRCEFSFEWYQVPIEFSEGDRDVFDIYVNKF